MTKAISFCIAALLLGGGPGFASLVGPRSLLDLAQRADLIVVGTASGTFSAGSSENFSIQIGRVVKGDPALTGSAVSVSWLGGSSNGLPTGTLVNAFGSGLWFMRRSESGWTLLPVLQGNVPLGMTFFPGPLGPIASAYAYDGNASLTDKIASEIGAAIEAGGDSYNLQLYSIHDGLLDQLQSPMVTVLYQRLSNSSSVAQRLLGLGGLIRQGNGVALLTASNLTTVTDGYPVEKGILLLSIRDFFRAADQGSVTALGQTATDSTNSSSAVREAAAHALAAIHSTSTLPYLAELLGDANSTLRVEAIGGIGAFANGLPSQTAAGVPSLAYLQLPQNSPFRTDDTIAHFALGSQAIEKNEGAYLSFWRQWWSQHRSELGL